MTSFNINTSNKLPQITEAQNMKNNGGGGNTGYMKAFKKRKRKKEEEVDSILLKGEIEDSFEYQEDEYEDDEDNREISPDDIFSKENIAQNDNKQTNAIKNVFLNLIDNVKTKVPKVVKEDVEPLQTLKMPDNGNFNNTFLSLSSKNYF